MSSRILSVGRRIAGLRKELGRRRGARITQSRLAEIVGVSRASIAGWEGDAQQPGGDNLLRLAAALGTTPEYLLTGYVTALYPESGGEWTELPRREASPEEYYDLQFTKSAAEVLTRWGAPRADEEHALAILTRIGSPGKDVQRKLDALEGLRQTYSTLGPVPSWWYQLRDQVKEGAL